MRKTTLLWLLVVLVGVGAGAGWFSDGFCAQRAPSLIVTMRGVSRGPLEFYKKSFVGSADSLFSVGTVVGNINGSHKDTLHTVTYLAEDWQSLQLAITGGSTVRLTIQVMGANLGDGNIAGLTDADFQILEWIVTGTGVNGDKVSTTLDSITAATVTSPINLYIDGAEVFKLMVIGSIDQVGNTDITGSLLRKRVLR